MFSVDGRSAQDKERTEVIRVRRMRLRQVAGDFLRECCQRRVTRQPWRRCINRPASARAEPRPVFPTW